MAINAYTGLMGGGKTYEVVSSVILPALKSGRDVVTNIYGLNYELVLQYLKEPDKGCEFGKLLIVENDDVHKPEFFPRSETDETSIVKHGNLVAIDEAWRFWGSTKWPQEHMIFFREHRHYVDKRGVSCDLALMVQDITDLDKRLKNVIELSFCFTKLKTLGFSKKYRVQVYEGSKLYKSKLTTWSTKNYNAKIFPLYKSYATSTVQGVEKSIDSRQNMLKSTAFFVPLLIAVVLIVGGGYKVYGFFNPPEVQKLRDKKDAQTKPAQPLPAVAAASNFPQPAGAISAPVDPGAAVSISGSLQIAGDDWIVLNTPEGLRILSPSAVYSRGVSQVTLDVEKAVPSYLSR